jgi:hypothetical protein
MKVASAFGKPRRQDTPSKTPCPHQRSPLLLAWAESEPRSLQVAVLPETHTCKTLASFIPCINEHMYVLCGGKARGNG